MPIDPEHIVHKKKKLVTHFPNGMPIPKEMQKMVYKGLKKVTDDHLHNCLVDASEKADEADGPMFEDGNYQLYYINNSVFIYDTDTNVIWLTKDSDPSDLTPEYWAKLAK